MLKQLNEHMSEESICRRNDKIASLCISSHISEENKKPWAPHVSTSLPYFTDLTNKRSVPILT